MRYFFTQALDAKSDDKERAKTALLDTGRNSVSSLQHAIRSLLR